MTKQSEVAFEWYPYANKTPIRKLQKSALNGKRVFLRVNYDIVRDARIIDDRRIRATVMDIRHIMKQGARTIVIVSHNGVRENFFKDNKTSVGVASDGEGHPGYSLKPVAKRLTEVLRDKKILQKDREVTITDDCIGEEVKSIISKDGIFLLENVMFRSGETSEDDNEVMEFAKQLHNTTLCDVYVNADPVTAHMGQHASLGPITRLISGPKVAGFLLTQELTALDNFMRKPHKPVVAIIGGANVSTKVEAMKNLIVFMERLTNWTLVVLISNLERILHVSKILDENTIEIIKDIHAEAIRLFASFVKAKPDNDDLLMAMAALPEEAKKQL